LEIGPAQIELGKRPKLEYQIVAAFHAQVLTVQQAEPETACCYCCGEKKLMQCMAKCRRCSAVECIETLELNTSARGIYQPSAVQSLSMV